MSNANVEFVADQNAVLLKNSLLVRKFTVPTGSWTNLRLGIYYGITSGSNSSMAGTPRFYFGLSAGTGSVLGDPVCNNFLGFRTNINNWTYNSGSLGFGLYYSIAGGQTVRRASGSVDYNSADIITSTMYFQMPYVSASIQRGKSCFFLDYTRYAFTGSAYLCTVTGYYGNGTAITDQRETQESFLDGMQQGGSTPVLIGGYVATTVVSGIRIDESSGSLDSILVAWDRESPVSDLIVYGLAVANY